MDSRSVAPSMNPMKEERGVTFNNNNFQIFKSRGLGVPGVLGSRVLSPEFFLPGSGSGGVTQNLPQFPGPF